MKNENSLKTYLFQPFKFIAGQTALISGIIILAFLTLLAYLSNTWFDGFIDVHYGSMNQPGTFLQHAYCVFGSWIIGVIVFYITSRIVSPAKTRIIDIAGTFAVAKWPLIFAALFGFISQVHVSFGPMDALEPGTLMQIMQDNILWLSLAGIVAGLLTLWSIFLIYNAYSVSANLKGTKGILSFIVALIIAEALSKLFLFLVI